MVIVRDGLLMTADSAAFVRISQKMEGKGL